MDFWRPVARAAKNATRTCACPNLVHANLCQRSILCRPAQCHEASNIGWHRRDIRRDMWEELRSSRAGLTKLVRLHERHATLVHHQTTRGQDARAVGVEVI